MPLRVLCFGASLTQGFSHQGLTIHPYSIRLQERLSALGAAVEVRTNGVPGDLVSGPAFRRRLINELERRRYDWMIILGGTNDLGCNVSVKETCQALHDAWDLALLKGSRVLALTIPECAARMDWLDERRDAVNAYILSYRRKNFHAFHLKDALPLRSLPPPDRERYWDDGLHLTPLGYDWMGSHIADALIPLLTLPATAPREDVFDEEEGNPHVLSQGYVVVRKRDLD